MRNFPVTSDNNERKEDQPVDALEALKTRTSSPRLVEPAPSAEDLRQIFQAALRAPDHAMLRPWRFLVVKGQARARLGELFAEAMAPETGEKRSKLLNAPLRAPLLIVVVAAVKEHPTVPPVEQVCSAAAAAQNISLAAYALGYASIWRTGAPAYDGKVKRGLGLQPTDEIVGFLYLGTPTVDRPVPENDIEDFVQDWEARPGQV